jgi:hypothetical protein
MAIRDPATGRFISKSEAFVRDVEKTQMAFDDMTTLRPIHRTKRPFLTLGNLIALGIMVGVVIAAAVLIR